MKCKASIGHIIQCRSLSQLLELTQRQVFSTVMNKSQVLPCINKVDKIGWKLVPRHIKKRRITLHDLHQLVKYAVPIPIRKLAGWHFHLINQITSRDNMMMSEQYIIQPLTGNFIQVTSGKW